MVAGPPLATSPAFTLAITRGLLNASVILDAIDRGTVRPLTSSASKGDDEDAEIGK